MSVSNNDKLLAYSLDLKGSEYYDIHIRKIANKKKLKDVIKETNGSILFSNDDKYILYVKLDSLHRSTMFQKIYKMSKIINNDSFLKSQIVQIHINNNGYFDIIPRIGNQKILFGLAENMENKFKANDF